MSDQIDQIGLNADQIDQIKGQIGLINDGQIDQIEDQIRLIE